MSPPFHTPPTNGYLALATASPSLIIVKTDFEYTVDIFFVMVTFYSGVNWPNYF